MTMEKKVSVSGKIGFYVDKGLIKKVTYLKIEFLSNLVTYITYIISQNEGIYLIRQMLSTSTFRYMSTSTS